MATWRRKDVAVEKKKKKREILAVSLPSSIIARAPRIAESDATRRGARRGDGVCPESNFVTPGRYSRAHLARSRARAPARFSGGA